MPRRRELGVSDPPDQQLDLSSLDGAFAAASPKARRTVIPDGHYHVQVEKVELTCARTSGRPILKWKLRIIGPACAHALLWKTNVVSSENLGWLKHDLHVCGLDLVCLSELPTHIDQLRDIELDVTKRTRGDWDNVYFNRRIDIAPPHDGNVPF